MLSSESKRFGRAAPRAQHVGAAHRAQRERAAPTEAKSTQNRSKIDDFDLKNAKIFFALRAGAARQGAARRRCAPGAARLVPAESKPSPNICKSVFETVD